MRTQAKTDFEKDLFKLVNNSVFGKTTENVRNGTSGFLLRNDVNSTEFKKLVRQPNYKSTIAFPECNLLSIEMYKTIFITIASNAITRTE